MISIRIGDWSHLGSDASAVRTAVFVQEQGIDESLEWDESDAVSTHCVAYRDGQAIATGRLLPDAHIGRMAVLASERGQGVGGKILGRLLQRGWRRGERSFELSAQTHAEHFYKGHGFVANGERYQEAGIEHQLMRLSSEVSTQQVTRPDGCQLLQVDWRGGPQARSVGHASADPAGARGIYLLHGLGEHCRRYDALAAWLNCLGWRVRAHDHRGHGGSQGKRGVLQRSGDITDDAQAQIEQFAKELGGPPLLLGHSMGGALAAELVVLRQIPVAGLILSSPALAIPLGSVMRRLVAVLNWVAPKLALSNGLDRQYLSHDSGEVAAYRGDPLVHDRACARLVRWIDQAGAESRAAASTLSVDTVLLVAGADKLVSPFGSREFAKRAGSSRVTLHWYEDAYHEIFNETDDRREKVLGDLRAWLERRGDGAGQFVDDDGSAAAT